MIASLINWLKRLFKRMYTYTLTKPDGTVHTFVSDVELPIGEAVIDSVPRGETVQGGGGPGQVHPPV